MSKEWYQQSINALQLNGKGERTQQAYTRALRQLVDFCGKPPEAISEAELEAYFLHRRNVSRSGCVALKLPGSQIRVRDRFVPLAKATHRLLQRFWQVHRNPVLLFPNRHAGLKGAASATTPLDRGGVQTTLHRVIGSCGLKQRSPLTAFGTATPPT